MRLEMKEQSILKHTYPATLNVFLCLRVRLHSVKAQCTTAGARIEDLLGANKEAFKGRVNLDALLLVCCQHLFNG